MDIEPLVRLVYGSHTLHGFTNTFIGTTIVGIGSIVVGKPISQCILRWWNSRLSPAQIKWFHVEPEVTWVAAFFAAIVGVYSHFILDAIMHYDASPWAPFTDKNPFAGTLSLQALNVICLGLLAIGAISLCGSYVWRRVVAQVKN